MSNEIKRGIKRVGRLIKTANLTESDIQDIGQKIKEAEEEVKRLENQRKQQNRTN